MPKELMRRMMVVMRTSFYVYVLHKGHGQKGSGLLMSQVIPGLSTGYGGSRNRSLDLARSKGTV